MYRLFLTLPTLFHTFDLNLHFLFGILFKDAPTYFVARISHIKRFPKHYSHKQIILQAEKLYQHIFKLLRFYMGSKTISSVK